MALLVAGQLMGEALVAVTGLPVPGSVVGMVLVLLAYPDQQKWLLYGLPIGLAYPFVGSVCCK